MKRLIFLLLLIFITSYLQFSLTQEDTNRFVIQKCSTCEAAKIEEFLAFIPKQSQFYPKFFPADPDFVADMIWLQTAYYFGLVASSGSTDYYYLPFLLNSIIDVAPQWDFPYVFGGVILLFESEMVPQGFKIIERGMQNLPDLWELWVFKGMYYLRFEGDYKKASQFVEEASKKRGAPQYLSALSVTMAIKSKDKAYIDTLITRLERTIKDDETMRGLLDKLK